MYTRTFRCGVFWFRTFAILMLIYRASLAFEVSTTPQVSVSVGATVELPCQTSLTDALVYWYYGNTAENATTLVVNVFKGEVIPRRDNVDMTSDFTLRITDVGVADSGVYVCKVVPSPWEGAPKSSATVLDVTTDTSTANNLASSTSSSTVATTSSTTLPQQKTTFSTLSTETPNSTTSAFRETRQTTLGSRRQNNGTTSANFEGDLVANQHVFTEGFIEVSSTSATTTIMTTKGSSKSDSDKMQVSSNSSKDGHTMIVAVSVGVSIIGLIAVIVLIICYKKWSNQNVQNRGPTVSYTVVSQRKTDPVV